LPPKFSEHSTEVLTEFGYSEDEVDALMAEGVVCATGRKR
jgi:crotonobetainyl-CoA:carnitine CoA-transferase CaiB-like acyl-CoA transferase